MTDTETTANEMRWYLLQRRAQEKRLREAFETFRASGIEPILIKGWAAARNYPDSKLRIPVGDVDLAVSSTNFQKADQLRAITAVQKLTIDLHNELRHLDTLNWEDLFSNSVLVDLEGTKIRVLRGEDHLRVMCVHWLTDGGSNRDRLWDIYFAVEKRPASFDWDRCLGSVAPHRQRWIECAIGLVHRYLDLNIDDLPFKDRALTIPSWVIRCVEKEWRRSGPLEPILTSVHDRKLLFQQVGRRLPPNPLRSMVQCEGDIDGRIQFGYQMRVLSRRAGPFLKDCISAVGRLRRS